MPQWQHSDEYDVPVVLSDEGNNLLDLEDVDNMERMEWDALMLEDDGDDELEIEAGREVSQETRLSTRQDRKRRQFQRSGD